MNRAFESAYRQDLLAGKSHIRSDTKHLPNPPEMESSGRSLFRIMGDFAPKAQAISSSRDGPGHRNIVLWHSDPIDVDTGEPLGVKVTAKYMTVLDVIPAGIACIEILDDHESRRQLLVALPD